MFKQNKREKERKRKKGKNQQKKTLFGLLAVMLLSLVLLSEPASAQPTIYGDFGVAIDAKTGEILYDKNANKQAYPASITKILTAILLEDHVKDNQKLTVSKEASYQECSCLVVKEGEQLSKDDALHALMIKSANDVSMVIAENVAGSVPAFADMMNEKAKELGAKNSNFVTPNGLHDPNHVTTTYDIALILKEALKYPRIMAAMKAEEYIVKTDVNTTTLTRNDRILNIDHAVGGKTGFTDQAGNTLAVYLKDGEKEVISVVIKSTRINGQHYADIDTMAKEGFKKLKVKKIIERNAKIGSGEVLGEKVALLADKDFTMTYTGEKEGEWTQKINVFKQPEKTIAAHTVVGELTVYEGKKVIGTVPLKTETEVVFKELKSYHSAVFAIAAPILCYVFWMMVNRTRYYANRRKKNG